MRLLSFLEGPRASYGAVVGDGVVDLGARLGARFPDVDALLAADALGEAAHLARRGADRPLAGLRYRLPVQARRVVCVGVNYDEHRKEMGREVPAHPVLFTRFASSLVAHGEAIERPAASARLDYEGELAVVIGRPGRDIPAARALEHVAGYACLDDGSVRDFQRHTPQFTPGKNFDRSGAFGPYLVTADEVPDPQALELVTRVDGEVVQSASTALMIFPVVELIRYVSSFMRLEPGDVIATGTPSGVGDKRDPPLYLAPGMTLEVEIERVGRLVNPVVAGG
jgi:2-keto-4-pentenoate hydratase/2-oxohepta-3-ene-1,7-dioic acid hydratase in catechol pathway